MNFQNEVHLPFVYTMTHFPHITVNISLKNMTHNLKNVINDILFFTIHTIFLWQYILDAIIKCSLVGQLLIVLWGKLYHTFYPSLCMSHMLKNVNTRISSSLAICSSLYTVFLTHIHGVHWATHTSDLLRLDSKTTACCQSHWKCTWKVKLICIHESTTTHFVHV
jgi:hypothetical protein